jgi:hypothetical protein
LLRFLLTGVKVAKFKWFKTTFEGGRMSGDPNTSLGNGLINMLLVKFYAYKRGLDLRAVFEGDDGLINVRKGRIHPAHAQDFFSQLGFTLKIAPASVLGEGGFCSSYFTAASLKPLRDPIEAMCRTWSFVIGTRRTALQLLRAKGYSLMYMCGDCPILGTYAKRILDLTKGHKPKFDHGGKGEWKERHVIEEIARHGTKRLDDHIPVIHPDDRVLVWKLFGIDIPLQLAMERDISSLPLGRFHAYWDWIFPESWKNYRWDYELVLYKGTPVGADAGLCGMFSREKLLALFRAFKDGDEAAIAADQAAQDH